MTASTSSGARRRPWRLATWAGACALAFVCTAVGAQVPNPVATAVPSTATPGDPSHDCVFFASDHDLRGHGYVEEEFFIEERPIATALLR
jgi:hypothetical protein